MFKFTLFAGRKYGIGSQKSVWDVLLQLESPSASTSSTATAAGSISFKNFISSAAGGKLIYYPFIPHNIY